MNVIMESHPRATLAIAAGRLDFGAAAEFQRQLDRALAGSPMAPAALIVDCNGLDYVSSAGLRVFLQAARAAQRAGIVFGLCALNPAVGEVFDLSGFRRIIPVYMDRATAMEHTPESGV